MITPVVNSRADEDSQKDESSKVEHLDESANLEHSPEAEKSSRKEELAKAHKVQVARDHPYAEAVRQMMSNLEQSAGLSDLRYVMTVRRHTEKTHVHLLLRRECTDTETGEKKMLHRLPETFLNGREEHGKARGGLLDIALSDALDTMISRRQRAGRTKSFDPSANTERPADDRPRQSEPDDANPREDKPRYASSLRRDEARPKTKL